MPDERRRAGALGALWIRFGAVSGQHDRRSEPGSSDAARGVDDDELVRLAQEGRREAFEELVRRHADRLYGVVLRFSGEPAEADEVVQETFLRAWRGIGSFERRAQFFTWLYGIGLNEAKRRATRRPPPDMLSAGSHCRPRASRTQSSPACATHPAAPDRPLTGRAGTLRDGQGATSREPRR